MQLSQTRGSSGHTRMDLSVSWETSCAVKSNFSNERQILGFPPEDKIHAIFFLCILKRLEGIFGMSCPVPERADLQNLKKK